MKLFNTILFFCISNIFFVSNLAALDKKGMGNQKIISLSDGIYVSEAEQEILGKEALRGSPDAAARLYVYFSSIGRSSEAIRWAQIAAENGHPYGASYLGSLLSREDDINSLIRSCFWLKRAKKSASSESIDFQIEELNQALSKKGFSCEKD
jgi:TPR repeat protein